MIRLLILLGLAHLALGGVVLAAAAPGGQLEDLQYRLSLGVWDDVARVHLKLTRVGPDRYRAEFNGAAQGAWKLLSRWLPEGYVTEMVLEDGRLKPLVYREEFQSKGRRISKEYRFDYARGVLEVWRSADGQQAEKSWQVLLTKQVYDPLSLFYNMRLGTFEPLTPGQTLRVALIPSPEPREMVFHIGSETGEGRKVMLELAAKGVESATSGPYFLFSTPQRVPQQAWTRVPVFGKLAGHLLNPGEIRKEVLPINPPVAAQTGNSPRLACTEEALR